MAALFIWLWVIGGIPAAVLSDVVRSATPRVARAGRIGFAFLLWLDLLMAAVVFSVGAEDSGSGHTTRSFWWFIVIGAGIPLALVSGFVVRHGYTGRHRPVLIAASLATAALYFVFPLGFVPPTQPLTGLARFEHDHHVLGVAILLIPTLILLADELTRKGEAVAPAPDLTPRDSGTRRRHLIGAGLFLVVLIWMAGTNIEGMLLALGVLLVAGALFLWHNDRVAMRAARRDLGPPPKH